MPWFEIGILSDPENGELRIIFIDANDEIVNHPCLEGGSFTVARKFGIDGFPIFDNE